MCSRCGYRYIHTSWTSWILQFKVHWRNFSAIVYIAVRIHVMNLSWKNPTLWFMFMLNVPNLQRVKLEYFMFHFMITAPAIYFPGLRSIHCPYILFTSFLSNRLRLLMCSFFIQNKLIKRPENIVCFFISTDSGLQVMPLLWLLTLLSLETSVGQ